MVRDALGMETRTHRDHGGLTTPLLGQELILRQLLLHALRLRALLVDLRHQQACAQWAKARFDEDMSTPTDTAQNSGTNGGKWLARADPADT